MDLGSIIGSTIPRVAVFPIVDPADPRIAAYVGRKDADDEIEVRCPECDAKVRVSVAEAERTNKAKCPNGHEVPLAKALGYELDSDDDDEASE